MNFTYLLINAIIIAVAVWGWYKLNQDENALFPVLVAFLGTIATMVIFVTGLTAPVGTSIVTNSVPFQIEKTEYRVIVKAVGNEYVFKDAETVANVARIERVQSNQGRNAWGFEVGNPTINLYFKQGK